MSTERPSVVSARGPLPSICTGWLVKGVQTEATSDSGVMGTRRLSNTLSLPLPLPMLVELTNTRTLL